jgi:hypothetical protein
MGYLAIELARTLDEDRFREAEHCRRINKALGMRQEQPTIPLESLVHWLQSLVRREQRVVTEQQARALPELS